MSDSPRSTSASPTSQHVREWSLAAMVSLCVALVVVAPFFHLGTASGHDVAFHMASWLDAAGQWKEGVIFPRWTEWANFGFGEPRFIFYRPLSWILGGWLRRISFFAVWFCAVWLSNAPAAVIASYSVALVFAVMALRQRSMSPMVNGAAGIALGFGFAAFYLIPAIYEQRWVNISGALGAGLKPAENFLFATTSDAEHDAFNRIASQLAVLLVVWVCAAGLAA